MKKLLSIVVLAGLVLPAFALAAVIKAGENMNISQAETIPENVYILSSNPIVAGTVQGDVVAVGGTISMTGNVRQGRT
jgi:hypothetical protein